MWSVNRICVFALCAFALLGAAPVAQADWGEGDKAPDLASYGLVGELPQTAGTVTYLDFWASWCAPCKQSFPELDALHRQYAERGFQVVAISVDTQEKPMQRFLDRLKPSFPVARDADQTLVKDAGIEVMPTSFLIDANGRIRFVHRGWHGEATKSELARQIESLLQEAGK